MRKGSTALALLGAIVGAGFASGREVLRFFTRYGGAGWLGVLIACAFMGACAYLVMRAAGRRQAGSFTALCGAYGGPRAAYAAKALYGALMAMTGGAMTAAFAELIALVVPIRGAYPLGFALAVLLGVLCSRKDLALLSLMGRLLLPLLGAMLVLLVPLPVQDEALRIETAGPAAAPVLGLFYGALNMGMAAGILCEAGRRIGERECRREAGGLTVMLLLLMGLGNAVLSRHGASVERSALPFVALSMRLGLAGYGLCAVVLGLAVLSTLTAAMRALRDEAGFSARGGDILCAACCLLSGALGFDRLIGKGYPLLGAMCACFLCALLVRAATDRGDKTGAQARGGAQGKGKRAFSSKAQ